MYMFMCMCMCIYRTRDSLVEAEHIVGGGLEVRGGVIALGHEALVARAVSDGAAQLAHGVEPDVGGGGGGKSST